MIRAYINCFITFSDDIIIIISIVSQVYYCSGGDFRDNFHSCLIFEVNVLTFDLLFLVFECYTLTDQFLAHLDSCYFLSKFRCS